MSKPNKVTFGDCWDHFMKADNKPKAISPEYDRMRSCASKVAYASEDLAAKALVLANRRPTKRTNVPVNFPSPFDKASQYIVDDGPGEYVFYTCRWCKMFHIGHKLEPKAAKAAKA